MRRALAVVGVHAVHTEAPVLTAVAQAVVQVVLAVGTSETWGLKKEEVSEERPKTPQPATHTHTAKKEGLVNIRYNIIPQM